MHQVLLHLEDVGFAAAPRFLGIDAQGREVLTYIEGTAGRDNRASIEDASGLARYAHLLKDYHEAIRGFQPDVGTEWVNGAQRINADEIVCHGDFGWQNVAWRDGHPVGLLDWDYAMPANPSYDISVGLIAVVPMADDWEVVNKQGWRVPPDRKHRIEVFAKAYGLTSSDGLVDQMIQNVETTRRLFMGLARRGIQPQADWLRYGNMAAFNRIREWMKQNRSLLE